MGTACHVQGGELLSQETQKQLGIKPGETTLDSRIDFQEITCLGCWRSGTSRGSGSENLWENDLRKGSQGLT